MMDGANAIDDIAADWAARLDRGLDADEQTELDRWLSEDPRHHGAFVRAQAIWTMLGCGNALAGGSSPGLTEGGSVADRPNRRWVLAAVASGVGAIATGGAMWLGFRGRSPGGEDFVTGRSQLATLQLDDGSKAIVNSNSAINVVYDSDRRLVSLNQGEGWFDVAKDAARPFIVRVNDFEARAVGTAFAVSRETEKGVVTVTEGVVEITGPRGMIGLEAGGRAMLSWQEGTMLVEALSADMLARKLAWRKGLVIFEGERLVQAVARLNEVNSTQITVRGDALGAKEITGSFGLFHPEQFAAAIGAMFSAKVVQNSNGILITDGQS